YTTLFRSGVCCMTRKERRAFRRDNRVIDRRSLLRALKKLNSEEHDLRFELEWKLAGYPNNFSFSQSTRSFGGSDPSLRRLRKEVARKESTVRYLKEQLDRKSVV